MKTYSFSQISRYKECPYQYKRIYIDKEKVLGSFRLSFGTSIHTTLQAFFEEIKSLNGKQQASLFPQKKDYSVISSNIKVPEKDFLLDLFKKKFVRSWYRDSSQEQHMFNTGVEVLSNFYDNQMGKWPHVLYVEEGFTALIDGIPIKGKIDRIDKTNQGVKIVDYKSGKRPPQVTPLNKEQLYVYQIAASDLTKFNAYGKVISLEYVYLTSGNEYTFLGAEEDIQDVKRSIKKVVVSINNKDFPATPSTSVCSRCPVKVGCSYSVV